MTQVQVGQYTLSLPRTFTSDKITIMNYKNIITIKQGKRGGQPTIRGMRITVYDVLKMLASGMSQQEILNDFPELNKSDIQAVLAYAAEREHRSSTINHETASRSKHILQAG